MMGPQVSIEMCANGAARFLSCLVDASPKGLGIGRLGTLLGTG